MSHTWTPSGLKSELKSAQAKVWRVVEHQHTHATRKLVDTQDEQMLLESILETSKPKYPAAVEHLDYLLKTPFRYLPVNRYGSRFRQARSRKGVFYTSESLRSALAETAFYRLRFFRQSESKLLPRSRQQLTAFTVRYKTHRQLDLMNAPLNRDAELWNSMSSYKATQSVANIACDAHAQSIRYLSVRDARKGANVAILDPAAFDCVQAIDRQTWYLYLSQHEVNFSRAHATDADDYWTFDRAFFDQMPPLTS